MDYPFLQELPRAVTTTDGFKGYNHRLRIADGEMYDERNLTSDYYPVLAPRGKRGIYARPQSAQGLIDKDTLCYVDGRDFVMDGYHVDMGLSTAAKDCPKKLVSMGAYIIILPDKMYINTIDLTDFGRIEASVTTSGNVRLAMCEMDGGDRNVDVVSGTAPEDPTDGQVWLDTSENPNVLKVWSEASGMWVSEATTYVRIEAAGIGAPFAVQDGVEITGLEEQGIDSSAIIWGRGDDYIVVTGILEEAVTVSTPVTVARTMPSMDFVIESGNRLWGCRYGIDRGGQIVNQIYASKLGDFKNWSCFMGAATDSYYVNLGSDGVFTGAVNYLGYPCFFKENHLHKVYGSYPANYQVQDIACRGVEKGSEGSLACVNEVLYYKSRYGICGYDGALPAEISQAFGSEKYTRAVGGSHGNKYYVAMLDAGGEACMMVYDTQRAVWHKEDGIDPACFCACRNELYYIERTDGSIRTVTGGGEAAEEAVNWEAVTWILGLDKPGSRGMVNMPEQKYLAKLALRMSMDRGARMEIFVEYDSSGKWERIAQLRQEKSMRTFTLPVRPKRCDHLRLKLRGTGDVRILSLSKWVEGASENNKADGQVLDF